MGFLGFTLIILAAAGGLAVFIIACIFVGLAMGIADGLLAFFMGRHLEKSALMQEKRPRFAKSCRVLGLTNAVVCLAAIVLMICFCIAFFLFLGADTPGNMLYIFLLLAVLLAFTGLTLTPVVGVWLIRIAGLHKKLEEPPLHHGLSILCRVLGIVTLIPGVLFLISVAVSVLTL